MIFRAKEFANHTCGFLALRIVAMAARCEKTFDAGRSRRESIANDCGIDENELASELRGESRQIGNVQEVIIHSVREPNF